MTYKSKLTLFVDMRKVKAIAEEQKQTISWYLGHLYAAIRLDISDKKGATFDCFTLDKVEADKLELEFSDIIDLKAFLRSGSYMYLKEVLGEPMELWQRDFDKEKEEGFW